MSSIIAPLFVVLSTLLILSVVTNRKFRNRLWSFWNRKVDSAADNLGDVVTDAKDTIKKAHVEVENFEDKITRLMAKIKVSKNEHEKYVAEAEKWHQIATNAAKAGDTNRARVAIGQKQDAEKKAVSIQQDTAKNAALCDKFRAQLTARKDEVRSAEVDINVQDARQASLQMREDMLKASSAFGGGATDLNKARRELDEFEARLDAKDELGGNLEELEQLYSVNTNVDDELQKLLSDVNQTTATASASASSSAKVSN